MESIKKQFDEVITATQGIEDPKTEDLFAEWKKNKQWFLDLNGGNPIYTYPKKIECKLNQEQKQYNLDNFIEKIVVPMDNAELSSFLSENKDTFYSNIVNSDYHLINGKLITKGSKIIKSLKYFTEDEKTLNYLQSYASRLIQQDKITGYLCLSVHPMDYLTMSENNNNWRSCHSLDGDYRSGNLSYMCDKTTIVAYIRSEKDVFLPKLHTTWNNKKWRVLLFNPEGCLFQFLGRQYPCELEDGLKLISMAWDEMIHPALYNFYYSYNRNWSNDYIQHKIIRFVRNKEHEIYPLKSKYVPIYEELIPITTLIQDQSYLHYNDLLYSTVYPNPYYRVLNIDFLDQATTVDSITPLKIGSEVKCLQCGHEYIYHPSTMLCNNCHGDYVIDNDNNNWWEV